MLSSRLPLERSMDLEAVVILWEPGRSAIPVTQDLKYLWEIDTVILTLWIHFRILYSFYNITRFLHQSTRNKRPCEVYCVVSNWGFCDIGYPSDTRIPSEFHNSQKYRSAIASISIFKITNIWPIAIIQNLTSRQAHWLYQYHMLWYVLTTYPSYSPAVPFTNMVQL